MTHVSSFSFFFFKFFCFSLFLLVFSFHITRVIRSVDKISCLLFPFTHTFSPPSFSEQHCSLCKLARSFSHGNGK
ncbi:hypothetical protein RIF29_30894 [Crotalaria pallida]|uniref:Uncharacterized protein n=1 Tax=Crotalaria pallida TaxID=3830 RepID=A0AAN9HX88_CROPI